MDTDFLQSIGEIWSSKDLVTDIIETKQIEEVMTLVVSFLKQTEPKSIIVTDDKHQLSQKTLKLKSSYYHKTVKSEHKKGLVTSQSFNYTNCKLRTIRISYQNNLI